MRLLKLIAFLSLTLAVGYGVAPYAAQSYIQGWLEDHGYSVHFDGVSVPFGKLEFLLTGVDVHSAEGPGVRAGEIALELNWWAWWTGRLYIQSWHSQGLQLELIDTPTGLAVLGFDAKGLDPFLNSAAGVTIANFSATDTQVCRRAGTGADASQRQCLRFGDINLSDAQLKREGAAWTLSSRLPARLEKVTLRDMKQDIALLLIEKAQFRDFAISPTWTRVAQFQATGFHFVERPAETKKTLSNPYQTQFDTLLLTDAAFKSDKPTQLNIDLMEIIGWKQTLHKDRQAILSMVSALQTFFPGLAQVFADPQNNLSLAINRTRVLKGSAVWLDDSTTPAVKQILPSVSFELGPINTLKWEVPVTVNLLAEFEKSGDIQLKGQFIPFAPKAQFELQGQVHGLNLAIYSPYFKPYFNEDILAGELNGTFLLRAAEQQLTLDAPVKLSQFYATGTGTVGKRSDDLTLARAFSLLRDREQAAHMNWRQAFNLNADAPPLSEQIAHSFKRTLTQMAKNHYKSTELVNELGVQNQPRPKRRLMPLNYSPNTRDLTLDQHKHLNNLVDLLRKNPSSRARLCPVSTAMEWAALYNNGKAPRKKA